MNAGRPIESLAAEVARARDAAVDYLAPTTSLTMELGPKAYRPVARPAVPDEFRRLLAKATPKPLDENDSMTTPRLVLAGVDFPPFDIRKIAHRQIGARLGIPAKYYDRMLQTAPELLTANVNHWLHHKPERRLVRTMDGSARALLSDGYRSIDNHLVLEAALPILMDKGRGLAVRSCELTETRLYIQASSPRLRADIRVGDTVEAGIVIRNSEVGHGAFAVETMLYRLSCLNGMITGNAIKRYHVGSRLNGDGDEAGQYYRPDTVRADDEALVLRVRDTVDAALSDEEFQKSIRQLRSATEDAVPPTAISQTITEVTNRYTVTDGEKVGILDRFILGADLTRYGLIQAITAQAHDASSYERGVDFERFGGDLAAMPRKVWNQITRVA